VNVARRRAGNLALEELLRKGNVLSVGAELAALPLALTSAQITAIAAQGWRPAIETCHRLRFVLTDQPLSLTPVQVVAIANNGGSKQALEAVKKHLPELCSPPYAL